MSASPRTVPFSWLSFFFWTYIGVFIAKETMAVWFGWNGLESFFCLSSSSSLWAQPWRLFTYSFLHRDGLHLCLNLLFLYACARFLLLDTLSPKRCFFLYVFGILAGGILWSFVHRHLTASILVGSSAGLCTLFTYFCLKYPDKSLSVLLYFFLPIRIQTKWCFWIFTAFETWSTIFYELQGFTHIAHSAHLGGILVGWLAIWYPKQRQTSFFAHKKPSRKMTYQVHRHSLVVFQKILPLPFSSIPYKNEIL